MLSVRNLCKSYEGKEVLRSLDLTVEDGALLGLMGQNGAGKTTLLRIAAGLLSADSGTVLVNGMDVRKRSQEVKSLIGYVPDEFGIYENLTVTAYMDFFAQAFGLYGRTGRMRCGELLESVGLNGRADDPVDLLSRGMQQRLSIARALIHDPSFLILDEPTSGLDPGSRFSVRELLLDLCERGKTILISSHILPELSEICSDIALLENGQIKATGEVSGILERIAHSNPLQVKVLNGEKTAMAILRSHPRVRTVTLSGDTFSIEFSGGELEEAELLRTLIESDIPVCGFIREPGSLESFFLRMTRSDTDKAVVYYDSESDESGL